MFLWDECCGVWLTVSYEWHVAGPSADSFESAPHGGDSGLASAGSVNNTFTFALTTNALLYCLPKLVSFPKYKFLLDSNVEKSVFLKPSHLLRGGIYKNIVFRLNGILDFYLVSGCQGISSDRCIWVAWRLFREYILFSGPHDSTANLLNCVNIKTLQ